MLLAGLVTLAIPVVGWHSIRQLDDAFEESRRREQQLRVNNAVASLTNNARLSSLLNVRSQPNEVGDLYAPRARFPVFVDGYADDWLELDTPTLPLTESSTDTRVSAALSVRATVRDRNLFVFVDITDDDVVIHQPPRLEFDYAEGERPDPFAQLANGDALEVFLQRPTGGATHGLFRAVAPGPLVARVASATDRRRLGSTLGSWRGYWTATQNGLQLELSMPLPPDGSIFGLAYVDVDERGAERSRWVGSLNPELMATRHASRVVDQSSPRLRLSSEQVFEELSAWVTPATRARLFDSQGRLLADVNALYEVDETAVTFDPATSSLWDALAFRFVSSMLRGRSGEFGRTPLYTRIDGLHLPTDVLDGNGPLKNARRYQTDENDFVLGTLARVPTDSGDGFILFESNDGRATSYAGSRLAKLLSLLTLVSLAVGGSLLLFATMLSFRIRRLSKKASAAVSKDGRITAFSPSPARDEIGDLSRAMGSLLGRTSNYTDYLEALSSRLSHELRTPLSVVRTSIENIDVDRLDDETRGLLERAGGGADQLGYIIRALVESTRLEQTVQQAQKVAFPLDAFLRGAKSRYQQVYPDLMFHTEHLGGETLYGSPELLQQALDKIVDNAVSFTEDQRVTLSVSTRVRNNKELVSLAVTNTGGFDNNTDPSNVFDPMFSSRTADDGNLHLGLGLYIVRMVAEAHGGRASFSAKDGKVTVAINIPAEPSTAR